MPTVSDDAGKSAIWYWPSTNAGAVKISIGTSFDDMNIDPIHEGSTNRTGGGRQIRVHLGRYDRVTCTVVVHTNRALYRALWGLEDHIRRGGLCAVAGNTVKAYASYVSTPLRPGDTVLRTQGSPFPSGVQTDGYPAVTLANGDEIVVQSAWPDSRCEIATVTSHSGDRIVCSGLTLDHTPPVLVRHFYFYPTMRLDPDAFERPALPVAHGYVHSVELALAEDAGAWKAAAGLGGAPLRQEGSKQGPTLDTYIDQTLQAATGSASLGTGRRITGQAKR